ncbi:hypothetical protein FPK62_21340, partial [Acinetobacter baumannii]|nr:hypothetical protein [Acinetobacter baumannii]
SYRDGVTSDTRLPSRFIPDLVIELALHKLIGRRTLNEVNVEKLYSVFDEVVDYFGSEKMAEFNYTIDDANQSFEEILRMLAGVSCCNDRRLNRQIYFELE